MASNVVYVWIASGPQFFGNVLLGSASNHKASSSAPQTNGPDCQLLPSKRIDRQLAINREIEHGQVARTPLQLQLGADGPDVP